MDNDTIAKYAQFVANRLDAAIEGIADPDQRATLKAALGPALALCSVCSRGLSRDSPSIVNAMFVCALDMSRAGIGEEAIAVSVSVPGPDGAQ